MTMVTQENDRVLIVGAGPTGLTAAAFLTQQNVDVDIIDPRSGPVNDSRALGVHARTLEFMAMLGIDNAFVEQGHQTRYMTFHRGARRLFRLDFNVISDQTRYPYMLVLPQSRSERILVKRLGELGQQVEWCSRLTSFGQSNDCVLATIERPDGSLAQRRYAYVIGCDGASSLVRKSLDIRFEGETYPLRFLLSEVEIADNAIDRHSSHVFMGRDTTVAVIPQPDNIYRIVGPDFANTDDDGAAGGAKDVDFSDFSAFLKRNDLLQNVDMHRPSRLVSYRIQKRVASQYRSGRVFIAGDAAHIHSPAGGQGMNTGLNDVANLSWKLAAVLQKRAPESLLDSYEGERRDAAISVVTNADAAMMRVVSRRPGARMFFDHIAPLLTKLYQPKGLMAAISQIAWSCPPMAGADGCAWAGLRMPDLPLANGAQASGTLGRGELVAFASGSGNWVTNWERRSERSCHRLSRPFAADRSKPFKGIILCRPDGYVATTLSPDQITSGSPLPSLTQLVG